MFGPDFWLAISFFILLFFTYSPVKKGILSYIDSEISKVKKEIDSSKKLLIDAEEKVERLRKQLKDIQRTESELVKVTEASIRNELLLAQEEIDFFVKTKNQKALHQLKLDKDLAIQEMKEMLNLNACKIAELYCLDNIDKLNNEKDVISLLQEKL